MMKSAEEIQDWLVSYVANLLGMASDEVDCRTPFDRYGLDSTAAVGLSGDLGQWLGVRFPENVVFECPTIEALAQHASQMAQAASRRAG